jgi:beta-N-acetylhexosaminidase
MRHSPLVGCPQHVAQALLCGLLVASAALHASRASTSAATSALPLGQMAHGSDMLFVDASAQLSASRAIGQMLMSHVTGLTASSRLLSRVRDGQVGSVILYREDIYNNSQLTRLTASIQRAAWAGGNPPVFIGIDQEGGSVKRVHNAPPTMSAQQMGASANPFAVAQRQGRATGVYLRRLGVNLDFAPVADIPTSANNFLQDRAFGRAQRVVVEGASGFAEGLAEGHIAGSAKHFPGLGAAGTRDSDFTLVSIGLSESLLQKAYAPYLAMDQLGSAVAPMVMISDAMYPHLDSSGLPAVLSRRIVQGQLAVAGMSERITITDDLEVPSVQHYPGAAVKAALAGDDILMFAQHEAGSERAYRALMSAVANHAIPKSVVLTAATKIIQLKQNLGIGRAWTARSRPQSGEPSGALHCGQDSLLPASAIGGGFLSCSGVRR